jgi:hypothetical protein
MLFIDKDKGIAPATTQTLVANCSRIAQCGKEAGASKRWDVRGKARVRQRHRQLKALFDYINLIKHNRTNPMGGLPYER